MPGVGGHLRRYRQKEGCMMNHSMEILCVVWWEKLAATHPDDLFPSEQQALERHVASCQACAAVRAEYQTIDALLLAGEDLEPLPVLSTQLLQPRKGPAHVPTMSELPRTMRLSALADRCMSEIDNYRRGEESNDQYCLEIFRRATQERDDAAWTLLVDRFQEFLLAAFRRHPRSEAASCLNSTILDMLRSYARTKEVPLPELDFATEAAVEDQDDGSELWKIIRDMLPNERERRLAFLLFHCNLKPREIVRLRPQEFPDVTEVHRMKRNIVDRLARSADLVRWRLSSEV